MEMIHSRSYTYVIKNVYPDPSEVFDTIIKDDRILSRAASVTESYDDFINEAQQWGQSSLWKDMDKSLDTSLPVLEMKEVKRKLYRAVANVNILEGIRFYVSLSLVVLLLVNLNSWKDQLKSYLLLQEMRTNILALTQNIINNWRKGDDPEMVEIMKEEEEWTYEMFDKCVNEEKKWAEYLFKDGTMIGLNDKFFTAVC